jgi:hypothetical protein
MHIFVVGLFLVSSFITATFVTHSAMAAEDVRWTKINIPTEGEAGNWVLSDGSDVQHLTMASDGTLYAYGKGLNHTLYKSTDDGVSWSYIGNVQEAIVGIATPPNDAATIYYATSSAVYRSTDGGKDFHSLPGIDGVGSNNLEITSIDVAWLNSNIIAIGTRDTDSFEFGGVYTLDEKDIIPTWIDTNLGNYDVYAVAFSPNYTADRQFVAVITDETDTLVTNKVGDAAWGATIGNAVLNKDNSEIPAPVAVANSAAIAFPTEYDNDFNCIQFIAIDTGSGQGDAYKITCAEAPGPSLATDLNTGSNYGLSNIDVTGLAARGSISEVHLLAGTADSAQTYYSHDGGISWIKSHKEPTGGAKTYVLMDLLNNNGKAYAVTSGDESAFSISQDDGDTWK